jgi:ubiquinone biosynthesis protein COQ4
MAKTEEAAMTTPTTDPTPPDDVTRLSAATRWRRALSALARVLADPTKTEQFLAFAMYVNAGSARTRALRFLDSAEGRHLYAERRAINSHTVDVDALARLPEGTLGQAYARFLRSHGLTPEVFDEPPRGIADERVQYIFQRVRQTHDLWHVVTGCDTDPAGEVALQAFTFAQLRAPSSGIVAVLGTLRGIRERPSLPREVARAYRDGRRAKAMVIFPWEDHWQTPLEDVRALLGVRVQRATA